METKKHSLGICAMQKKIHSPHMKAILEEIDRFGEFELIEFTNDILFNKDVEEWPIVEALIIFFSNGFPFGKALNYIQMRKPFLINDFASQRIFWDRREVRKLLQKNNIITPKGFDIDRGDIIDNDTNTSYIELNNSKEIKDMIDDYNKRYKNNNNNEKLEKKMCSNTSCESVKSIKSYLFKKKAKANEDIGTIKTKSNTSLININNNNYSNDNKNISIVESIDNISQIDSITNITINSNKNIMNNIYDTDSVNETNDIINNDDDEIKLKVDDEDNNDNSDLIETDEFIKYKGQKLFKPFVEKPCNGDDHNIYIYYPPAHGGGVKKLFRKYKNYSSLYYPDENNIRRDKSYCYEEFLQSDGFDIKVYTVGEDYFHAEARKSPSLDGKVQRSKEGKEVRYPVNLTSEEKEIARKIVHIFKQNVCGFDILRSNGISYVCDVNGWSFVKGNKRYYQDCAIMLRKIILQEIDKDLLNKKPLNFELKGYSAKTKPIKKEEEELKSVVAIIRHADRSPKQKLKLVVEDPYILSLFDRFGEKIKVADLGEKINVSDLYEDNEIKNKIKNGEIIINNNYKIPEIKLKKPKELMAVLDIVYKILDNTKIIKQNQLTENENKFDVKIFQIKLILEKNLNFEGLTRKIQLRPLEYRITNDSKIQITKALLIMKWGGTITHSGIDQAIKLGREFRAKFYPTTPGSGEDLLRLHSTYRHDMKCYSSEEGRCLKSAAAFLKGLLDLNDNLGPIITSMVRKDKEINKLLDVSSTDIDSFKNHIKNRFNELCNFDGPLLERYNKLFEPLNSKEDEPFVNLIKNIGNFYSKMKQVATLLEKVTRTLKKSVDPKDSAADFKTSTYYLKNAKSIKARSKKGSKIKMIREELLNPLKKPIIRYKTFKSETPEFFELNHENYEGTGQQSICGTERENKCACNLKKKNIVNELNDFDCQEEKAILIFKRYVKLKEDFYNKKTSKYDISKIPDIFDNIKYDLIHNKNLVKESGIELFNTVNDLAKFIMPLEYGITAEEKMKIALKFIKPLIKKIRDDLLTRSHDNTKVSLDALTPIENQEKSFSGLDQDKLNDMEIKSSWRHIKTRFYFTSQSHIYSLLNTLMYGLRSILVSSPSSGDINPIWNTFDLDYCSHIVFRLFEDLKVPSSDLKKRFRIEILVNPGANGNPSQSNSNNHMLPLEGWMVLNERVSVDVLKRYFNIILNENDEENIGDNQKNGEEK